ncbi:MAG: TlpA family protein disulfide reductase [Gammaproteobacteria bacterium]|nr:TlpA family protein disulfide reductase [Gammaproteobacteria bacterium]
MRIFGLMMAMLLVFPAMAADKTVAAPAFTVAGQKGNITLSQYRGKVVMLDFWASWCGPCRHSFPWMNEMQAKYQSKGLEVVAISLDSEREPANKFLEKYPAKFTIGFDLNGSVADKYEVSVMPTSYLIDRKGNIAEVHYGFRSEDAGKLEAKIKELLAK